MAQVYMKGDVRRVNDSCTSLSLAFPNKNVEETFLFKDRVTTAILHFLLAFEVC